MTDSTRKQPTTGGRLRALADAVKAAALCTVFIGPLHAPSAAWSAYSQRRAHQRKEEAGRRPRRGQPLYMRGRA